MIRIPRLGHIGVLMLLFCVAFPFFGWPAVLWVLFVIPAGVALWIERTRTTVSARGLDLRTLSGSRHIDWSQIKGLRIPKRGYVRVHLADDSEVALPAVGYDRLRALIEASDGRIPDPFAQPEEGASGEANGPETTPEEDASKEPNGAGTTPGEDASREANGAGTTPEEGASEEPDAAGTTAVEGASAE
ncbi:PH domain-containing protein, partial [Nocardia wallacei]|uniref:PH domain-containing protein n=1 Tax=Nocardia wallacei TaxID=480035 RepID=UPI00245818D4